MPRKSSRAGLSKLEFCIFFKEIIRRCFGKTFNASKYTKEGLYGYNSALNEGGTIRAHIRASTQDQVNTRELSKAVDRYPQTSDTGKIYLPNSVYKPCMKFLHEENVATLVERFFRDNKLDRNSFVLPSVLIEFKHDKTQYGFDASIDRKLSRMAKSNWHFYTHYMRGRPFDNFPPQILRLPFKITNKVAGGNYEIELSQSSPFTTFEGLIVRKYSGDNILVCELTSKDKSVAKRVYMTIHVDLSGEGTMLVGSFMRYTDGAAIYTGTFVLEQIDEPQLVKLEPQVFDYFGLDSDQPKLVIQKFLFDGMSNLIRLPTGVYNETDFITWHKKKEGGLQNPMPDIDLYITAPVNGFERALPSKVNYPEGEIPKTVEELRQEVIKMIDNLKSKEVGFSEIWYSLADPDLWDKANLDPNYLLNIHFEKFRKSKRILIILPFPCVTSTFLEIGWTLMNAYPKPVYICYSGREDLPFLLRKVDKERPWIQMRSLAKLGGIEGIPDWIINNKYHKL